MNDEEAQATSAGDVQLGAAAEATVTAYHQLAMDADKRLHLALDDTCLQFLSLVIGNGDNSLVKAALLTLAALAESPECRAPMASTFGVLHCLKASVEEDNEHTEEMKSQSAELFTCLNFAYHQQRAARRRSKISGPSRENADSAKPNEHSKQADSSKDTLPGSTIITSDASSKISKENEKETNRKNTVEKKENANNDDKDADRGRSVKRDSVDSNCSSVSQSSCSQPSQKIQAQNSPSSGGGRYYRDPKHRTRMITLHVKGMLTPSERSLVEEALVRVRGVISLVFDLSRSRVSCRVRRVLDLSKLGSAVDALNSNMSLYQVVTKNQGEEVEIPLSKSSSKADSDDSPSKATAEGSDTELPDYLPEEDECQGEDDPKTAVATSGVALKEAASSLFSAAASLLQQSFYW